MSTSIKAQLERVQLKDTQIKLVINQRIYDQIRYLCKEIALVEWSGVLFYSVQGSIKDPENMVITIEDILPMHKGTSGYTEYALDERVISYMMENETMEKDWKMGHIHSHNSMKVFFSGTDWSELEDNSPNHNFYTSLIVNNKMEFCAKVSFIIKPQSSDTVQYTAQDEEGEPYSFINGSSPEEKLAVYDCAISSPVDINVETEFATKVKGIISKAEKEAKAKAAAKAKKVVTKTYGTKNSFQKQKHNKPYREQSLNKKYLANSSNTGKKADFFQKASINQPIWGESFQSGGLSGADQNEVGYEEEFAMVVLNGGDTDILQFKDPVDILKHCIGFGVVPIELSTLMMSQYVQTFSEYYPSKANNQGFLIEVTEEFIQDLEEIIARERIDVKAMALACKEALENFIVKFKQEV